MKIQIAILFGLVLNWIHPAKEVLTGKVTEVIDGNTMELRTTEGVMVTINLYGVDCPEAKQMMGAEAKQLLEANVKGKTVEVVVQGKDRWGMRQAVVIPEDGSDPRIKLLEAGLAWTSDKVYPVSSQNGLEELESIRLKARSQAKGLWVESNPTPPWVFRRHQTMTSPKFR